MLPAKRLDEGTYPLDGRQAVGDDTANGDIQSSNVTLQQNDVTRIYVLMGTSQSTHGIA